MSDTKRRFVVVEDHDGSGMFCLGIFDDYRTALGTVMDCKAEYAPHNGCKIGMPEVFTPDGTTRDKVETCYIVTLKFRSGEISTCPDCMYLSDGRFYWYDNLWDDDEVVENEITDEWFIEPIAWIPYKNDPVHDVIYPVAPCNEDAVPTPPTPKAWNRRAGEAE